MTTSIIDPSVHVASFPSTYTGPGTLIGNTIQSGGDETDVHGYFTSNGNTVQINLGFQPMRVHIVNITDGIQWDWMYGFPATDTIKTTDATPAFATDTTSQIVATDQSGSTNIDGNWILTLGTTLCGTSKVICFHVEG